MERSNLKLFFDNAWGEEAKHFVTLEERYPFKDQNKTTIEQDDGSLTEFYTRPVPPSDNLGPISDNQSHKPGKTIFSDKSHSVAYTDVPKQLLNKQITNSEKGVSKP